MDSNHHSQIQSLLSCHWTKGQGNNLRVGNLRLSLICPCGVPMGLVLVGRFAPELLATEFAREMWALFEQGELRPDSELTGVFALDQTVVDPDDVLLVIDDAREEEIQRQLRLAG